MKNIHFLAIMLIVFVLGFQEKSSAKNAKYPLKVLFVGYDVNRMPQEFREGLDEFTAKDSVRMPAFKALLNNYFTEVKTIDCRDWKPEDSKPFDVTVFDYRTTPIEKEGNEDGKNAQKYYLPDDFSKPVIFIGGTADIMGQSIGLKLDWLCLCLDADAHHLNTHHAIFNGPVENVIPSMVMKATPDGIYNYPSGDSIPKTIPMWQVQKLSYMRGDETRVGLVSRGEQFTDSPDAEVISSGVCLKNVSAVALGRHGNFFLWGFAASPDNMTEEAKKVFVNTVVYMKQFDGRLPIVRKYNVRMATTDNIRDIIDRATKAFWEKYVAYIEHINEEIIKSKKEIEAKLASGKQLTDMEKMSMNIPSQAIPTWEDYLKKNMGEFHKQFGNKADDYRKFMNENLKFMYCDPNGFFSYSIDEDVKKLNISNHDPKLLEACIRMLKENKNKELALRILKRYTPENFDTAAEWENWYNTNKDRLFFTETGGYKFLINTYEK